ncbi:MAG: hypothetical protein WBO00_09710 [Steroidobacteraceae bacterium]
MTFLLHMENPFPDSDAPAIQIIRSFVAGTAKRTRPLIQSKAGEQAYRVGLDPRFRAVAAIMPAEYVKFCILMVKASLSVMAVPASAAKAR